MAQEYRYQLHDPRDDARYIFHRASEATRKADELGATQFQYTPRENEFVQVAKFEETWSAYESERDASGEKRTPIEGQSLDDIQAAEDRQAASDIAARAVDSRDQDEAAAKARAEQDAAALRRIDNERTREAAVAQIATAAQASETYKAAFERSPGGSAALATAAQPARSDVVYDVFDPGTGHTQTFVTAREAGEAFYQADRTSRPLVTESVENGQVRVMADTKRYERGDNPEHAQYVKTLPADKEAADKAFVGGYLDAMESDLNKKLAGLDWQEAQQRAGNQDSPPDVGAQTTDDLEQLAKHRPERVVAMWQEHAPADAPKPYFADERYHQERAALRQTSEALEADQRAREAASRRVAGQDEESPPMRQMELAEAEYEAEQASKGRAGQAAEVPAVEQAADKQSEAAPKAADAEAATETKKEPGPEAERGVPMQTIPGARMVYNDQAGQAGAEIHHADGQVTSFGGREAIDEYARENKLSVQERETLRTLDMRADEARRDPNEAVRFDDQSKALLAARRAADREAVQAQLEANAVEQGRVNERASKRAAPVQDGGDNEVQSDEMFHTAESDRKPLAPQDAMPPDLDKHFLKVGARDYHFSKNPDTLAFSDRGNKLETKSNSAFVADTMVKIAQARGWDEIKVTGSEAFKREVWLEAASKGMTVKGYQPTDVDRARLEAITKRQAFRGRETQNQVEQIQEKLHEKPKTREQLMAESFRKDKPEEAVKKYPELAGAYAGVEAQRRRVHAEHLTADQTKSALDRINRNAANSIEKGKIPQVKVEVREQVEVTETKEVRTHHHQHRDIER